MSQNSRLAFKHQGRVIYEWQETLENILVFIKPPPALLPKNRKLYQQNNPGQKQPTLQVKISNQRVSVGIKGLPPYLDHNTKGLVDTTESTWTIEDDQMQIILQKAYKGEAWHCAFEGHEKQTNILDREQVDKKLLLERFQQQNPGFDFSGAEINGQVPQARTFMGGVKYN